MKKTELNVLTFGYMPLTYWKNWFKNIRQFFRNLKYAYQRITRGYCDKDIWDLDSYYSTLFYLTLKQLSDTTISHPCRIQYDDWKYILNEMAEHFLNTQEWNEEIPINQEVNKAYDEMNTYVSKWDFEPVPDKSYLTLVEEYSDEVKYNRAKKKWLKKEMNAYRFRVEEKNRALDMMKEYFFDLWD